MIRGLTMRRAAAVTITLLAAVTVVGPGSPLQAAPARPNAVTITGENLPEPLTVRAEDDPAIFTALLDQVSLLTGSNGRTTAPKKADLGPKYTLVVLVSDAAKQTYDLYPQAKGGPRAFRPAKQPDGRRTTAAWYFGRLSMSETLRVAGVPLPKQGDTISGGIGGGERVIPEEDLNAGKHVDQLIDDLRRLLLINGAVLVAITACLAGIALLARRRTR